MKTCDARVPDKELRWLIRCELPPGHAGCHESGRHVWVYHEGHWYWNKGKKHAEAIAEASLPHVPHGTLASMAKKVTTIYQHGA